MLKATKFLAENYSCSLKELYSLLKEEIKSSPNGYHPNPLSSLGCIHIRNQEYEDQPILIEGQLELIGEFIYATCFLKDKEWNVDWSLPIWVELNDLWIDTEMECIKMKEDPCCESYAF